MDNPADVSQKITDYSAFYRESEILLRVGSEE